MRKPIIAGNWKMNKTPAEAGGTGQGPDPAGQGRQVRRGWSAPPPCASPLWRKSSRAPTSSWARRTCILPRRAPTPANCPPTCSRPWAVSTSSSAIPSVASTSARPTRPSTLRATAAVKAGLTAIICRGRDEGRARGRLHRHHRRLSDEDGAQGPHREELNHVVIAYEPVWAIGTGLTATDEQANETIGVIRKAIADVYGDDVAQKGAHPVRRQHEGLQRQGPDGAAGDRRRPHRRRFPQG